jgi:hypothetical protein
VTKIIPYEPEHFLSVTKTSEYFAQLHTLYNFGSPSDVAKMYLRGPAYTMIAPEGIVGCGGIMKLWKGVGDAWVLATPLFKLYPKEVTSVVKTHLNTIIYNMRFERVQAIVKKDFEVGHRWIKRLGFHEEGPLDKYFGGIDFVRYAIITEFKE